MAKRPTKKKVTKAKSNLPANWKQQASAKAKQVAERVPVGVGNNLQLHRSGEFRFQGASLGQELDVVIVDFVFANKYYSTDYDEDNITPPSCFALGVNEDTMAPDASSPEQQNPACEDCWANQFKSAGKGKACGNKRRLALLHSDSLDGEMLMLELPPTTIKAFDLYVSKITGTVHLPTSCVLTRLSFDDQADHQKLEFAFVEALPDKIAGACFMRTYEAEKALLTPYNTSGYEKPKDAKPRGHAATRKKTSARPARSTRKKATKKRSKMS